MTRKDKCKRNNDKDVVKISSKDIADGDKLYPYTWHIKMQLLLFKTLIVSDKFIASSNQRLGCAFDSYTVISQRISLANLHPLSLFFEKIPRRFTHRYNTNTEAMSIFFCAFCGGKWGSLWIYRDIAWQRQFPWTNKFIELICLHLLSNFLIDIFLFSG